MSLPKNSDRNPLLKGVRYAEAILSVEHGNNLLAANKCYEAIASYDRALEIDPSEYTAWYGRGNAFISLGKYKKSIQCFDRAVEIKPDYHQAWYNLGSALGLLGRYSEAIQCFDRVLKIDPNDSEAWYSHGVGLQGLGQYSEAIVSYNRAIEIDPNNYQSWNNRGSTFTKMARYEEAICNFNRALELQPTATTFFARACVYALIGEADLSIDSLQQANNLEPKRYIDLAKKDRTFTLLHQDFRFLNLVKGSQESRIQIKKSLRRNIQNWISKLLHP